MSENKSNTMWHPIAAMVATATNPVSFPNHQELCMVIPRYGRQTPAMMQYRHADYLNPNANYFLDVSEVWRMLDSKCETEDDIFDHWEPTVLDTSVASYWAPLDLPENLTDMFTSQLARQLQRMEFPDITYKDVEDTLALLNQHPGTPRSVLNALTSIYTTADPKKPIELANLNTYFARVLWKDEDIRRALHAGGFPATPDNIGIVLDQLDVDQLNDCSVGNERIQDTVNDCGQQEHCDTWTEETIRNLYPEQAFTEEQIKRWLPILNNPNFQEANYDELMDGHDPIELLVQMKL